jgi:hypothetical protein
MEEIKNLNEDLDSAESPKVATTDENLTLGQMFHQVDMPSLPRQIFSTVPIFGPTGGLFNLRKKSGLDSAGNIVFELVRNDVEVYNSNSISTGLTQEVVQDIKSHFGSETNLVLGKLLRDLANADENTKALAFLESESVSTTGISLSGNAEENLFNVTQKVHELILKINSETMRSYRAFAVIPYKPLGGIMGLSKYAGGGIDSERGLFIAEFGQTKFYLNPDATSTTAYVGIRDFNPSTSSVVFSPYTSDVIEAVNPDDGEMSFHLFNRYAITASPLHVAGNEMLYKFDIT